MLPDLSPDPVFWKDRRVFITGHTGFKGSWLTAWLTELGATVGGYALAPCTEPNLFDMVGLHASSHHVLGDIRDAASLSSAMKRFDPDIAIHMAAQPLVRLSYAQPVETFDVNVQGTVNFLEACRSQGSLRVVIVVTTDKCYVNQEWAWSYRETDPLGGRDPYSASKACAEIVTTAYRESFFPATRHGQHRVAVAQARAGNVFGGGDWSTDRLVPDIIRAIGRQDSIKIRNPHAVRPWQHVLEPLSGYLMLARACFEHGPRYAQAWNFGPSDDQNLTVLEFVKMMTEAWGGTRFEIAPDAEAPHEAQLLLLDSGLARRCLGWRPSMTVTSAIASTVEWYRAYLSDAGRATMRRITREQIHRFASAGDPAAST